MTDDIVTRLRESEWNENPQTNVRLCADAADEIERLRDAGDALVAAIRNHILSEKDIRAWEDARRG